MDPLNSEYGTPARLAVVANEKVRDWQFLGSLDATRNPLAVMRAACKWFRVNEEQVAILSYKDSPVAHQLALEVAQLFSPTRVVVPDGSDLDSIEWPVGAEKIELEDELPPMVRSAQRRACWIDFFEKSEIHEFGFDQLTMMGARLGSGKKIVGASWNGIAEKCGSTLMLVGHAEPTDEQISSLLNLSHCQKVLVQDPMAYHGLCCALCDSLGTEFGFGVIQNLDLSSKKVVLASPAVSPAPCRLLRIGSLKIESNGVELQEAKPWSF